MKKRLTVAEEFEILKLVLDKFLWIGMAIIGYGLWTAFVGDTTDGFTLILAGIVVLLFFMVLLVKEYEIIEHR
ncbi:MAG: hypothetical protein QF824_00715 [Candidatus Woesearchaeota archaeon]|nr:hypothetical protein [Candidatus Woesearchaeota archaeon]